MTPSDKQYADDLRAALLKLEASGGAGFEGLVAVVLTNLFNQPFRLATSGTQRGRDGDSAFDNGEVYFEAKRYEGKLRKTDVAPKLFDLSLDDQGQVDLWVFGVTTEVGAQVAGDLKAFARKHGIGTILLDWSDTAIGSLVVAIAAAGSSAKQFICDSLSRTDHAALIKPAIDAVDHFAKHANHQALLATLLETLKSAEAGLGHTKINNQIWAKKVFASRARAGAEFGQPLAPLDGSIMAPRARPAQRLLENAFHGPATGDVYAVMGDEGVGKSWLAVNSWLSCATKSLLVICTADELLDTRDGTAFETMLIAKLIRQTNEKESDVLVSRWRRRLKGWRANPRPDNVRVTLVIDGLNQTQSQEWSRWLNLYALELEELGGCLVFTTRSTHWAHLRRSITSNVKEVLVTAWTPEELSALLRELDIHVADLNRKVFESLRNPRLLGVAVDLMKAQEISFFHELSVGRLMFEHMRKAQNNGSPELSGRGFAQLLQSLAKQVVERTTAQQTDDLRLFAIDQEEKLEAVASCQFFAPVQGDESLYEIREPGLNLGIAIWLNNELEREVRNKRNPHEKLAALLEPISALDETAAIVALAAARACLTEDTSIGVRTTLIEHFISLQNLPREEKSAFASMARVAPEAYLIAMKQVCLSRKHIPNSNWLLQALWAYRDDQAVWEKMTKHVEEWLSLYSLAPERMIFNYGEREKPDELLRQQRKLQGELDVKVAALTSYERRFIDLELNESLDLHLEDLHRTAFYLLAGKPLRDFAPSLMRWAVSDALSPAMMAPDKEFRHLVRLNLVDWHETREHLTRLAAPFLAVDASPVGQWAGVEILRATGDASDSRSAEKIVEVLVRDRERFEGGRMVERYCASDPCDPYSEVPDNIAETALDYRDIDVSDLAMNMGNGPSDHFFQMARTGVARFAPDDALFAYRKLADDILRREGFALRQGVLSLLAHSAALTAEQAKGFLVLGQAITAELSEDADRDDWLTAQYALSIAFAHLSPDKQFEKLGDVQTDTVWLDLLDSLGVASPELVQAVLGKVFRNGNEQIQSIIVGAIQYSRPELTDAVRSMIVDLAASADQAVRAQALGIIAWAGDDVMLRSVVQSGWTAQGMLRPEDEFEAWHGSSAILAACERELIDADDALERIGLDHYGFAAVSLGARGAALIAPRITASVAAALAHEISNELPEMETTSPDPGSATIRRCSLSTRRLATMNPHPRQTG
jgi:hypothetical protein